MIIDPIDTAIAVPLFTLNDSGPNFNLKNFGFKNEVEVVMPGTNAKMNEFQALMGSIILGHIAEIIEKRKKITAVYREKLSGVSGIRLVPEFSQEILVFYRIRD